MSKDIYTHVTQAIVTAIEAGETKCTMPWHHDGTPISRPMNAFTQKAYRGINTVLLWAAAAERGYAAGQWATYRAWAEHGAQVRKGEKGTTIIFWKSLDTDEAEDGDESSARPMVARAYTVFNQSQVDGYEAPALPQLPETERIARAEAFFTNLGIETHFGGSEAYYHIRDDVIHLPPFASFTSAEAMYAVYAHEAGHAAGAKHRLDRDLTRRFKSHELAAEEIIAELAAANVLALLQISARLRADHAGYIASWLTLFKNDTRAIFSLAAQAQAAADWMVSRQADGFSLPS